MKHYYLDQLIFSLFSLWLLMAPPLQAAEQGSSAYKYCWIEDEVKTCGNVVPPEYAQKGFEVYKDGVLWKIVDPAPSAKQIAEMMQKAEEEEKRKKQEKEDRSLLDLFSTEQDIERNRSAILATIDGQVHSIEPIIASLEKNLGDLEKNLEESLNNKEVSESQRQAIQKNIEDAKYRLKTNKETLQAKFKEKVEVHKQYDEYLRRYRDIRKRGVKPAEEKKATTPTPAAGATPPQ
jgi:hypothetical protein